MNAHSAARTAGLVLLAGLAAGSAGCKHGRQHARRIVDACLPPAECATPSPSAKSTTPPPAVVTKSAADPCPAPCPPKAACTDAGCAPSVVEVRDTPPVHVKVPPRDVIVELPPQSAPPAAMTAPPAAMVAAPGAMTGGLVPATVNHVPANRARLGFAFDTIRIPFPILRPIAVPTQPEVTMAVAPAQLVQAAPTQFVQPAAAVAAPPAQLVQPPAQLVQPPPQLVQPPPQLVQPPPQLVQPPPQLVQPPAHLVQQAPTQFVQPPPTQFVQAPTQFVQPPPAAAMAPSQQSVDEYCRQVDALMRALEASKRAAGCPPTPGR
ncbi:MAG: hypothetical protein U0804_06430 [Gemmataceae bacterium]